MLLKQRANSRKARPAAESHPTHHPQRSFGSALCLVCRQQQHLEKVKTPTLKHPASVSSLMPEQKLFRAGLLLLSFNVDLI